MDFNSKAAAPEGSSIDYEEQPRGADGHRVEVKNATQSRHVKSRPRDPQSQTRHHEGRGADEVGFNSGAGALAACPTHGK